MTFNAAEVLRELDKELERPFTPFLRLYLGEIPPDTASTLCSRLPDYDVVIGSGRECALLRRMQFSFRDAFIDECMRVANVLELERNGWSLKAIYDADRCRINF